MNTENPDILFEKNGLIFRKNYKHNYEIVLDLENKNICLDKILDFGFMKLIYDLNPDIYLTSNIEKLSEDEAEVSVLLKHFFEDIGMQQTYSFINIKKKVEDDCIKFLSTVIEDRRPEGIPDNVVLSQIKNMICVCKIITPHHIKITFNIFLREDRLVLPLFVQKIIGQILNKIFIRIKQFIENIT